MRRRRIFSISTVFLAYFAGETPEMYMYSLLEEGIARGISSPGLLWGC